MRIKERFKSKEVFIFDFDMTLVNSSQGIVKCFSIVLDRYGYSVNEEAIKRTIGMGLDTAFKVLTSADIDLIKEMSDEFVEAADEHMTENTTWFSYSEDVLKALKETGKKIVIVSSKYKRRIVEFLEKTSVNSVDLVIGGDEVQKTKPAPDGINKAVKLLNVNKEKCIYFGDTIIDEAAAHNSGVDFVGVLTGPNCASEFREDCILIKDLRGLLNEE